MNNLQRKLIDRLTEVTVFWVLSFAACSERAERVATSLYPIPFEKTETEFL
jgi:hypothetical protein